MRGVRRATAIGLFVSGLGIAVLSAQTEPARTLEDVQSLNDAVAGMYVAMHEEWIPYMGVHWGAPGPAVLVAVADDGTVAAYELIVPEQAGWFPWFDQPEGDPMVLPELGRVYTQHIYVTHPESVEPGATPIHVELNWSDLVAVNPGIADYVRISEWVPQMGFHYGPPELGPALVVLVGEDEAVYGFEIIQPADLGWLPWFDQPEGEPMELPFGLAYTQHVYVVNPADIPVH
jgi:hypothetical protein